MTAKKPKPRFYSDILLDRTLPGLVEDLYGDKPPPNTSVRGLIREIRKTIKRWWFYRSLVKPEANSE